MSHDSYRKLPVDELEAAIAKAIVELDCYKANLSKDLHASRTLLKYLVETAKIDCKDGRKKPPIIYILQMFSELKCLNLKHNYSTTYKLTVDYLDRSLERIEAANGKLPNETRTKHVRKVRDFLDALLKRLR